MSHSGDIVTKTKVALANLPLRLRGAEMTAGILANVTNHGKRRRRIAVFSRR
jgi:hypothetical protein